jgi:hypothetical protein
MVSCARCMTFNRPTARFCTFCAKPLHASSGTTAIFEAMMREAIGQLRDSGLSTPAVETLKEQARETLAFFQALPKMNPKPDSETTKQQINECTRIALEAIRILGPR